MIERPLILGFTPTSCTQLTDRSWSVTAIVDDPIEINDGWSIARKDVVFLDFRSVTTPASVGRYSINSIINKASRTIGVVLDWASAAVPVSPQASLGVRGYLAQAVDAAGTVQHPTPQTILLPQAVIDLAKQADIFAVGDESSESEQVRSFPMAEALSVGDLVHVTSSGAVILSMPQDLERMPAAGIVMSMQDGLARVRVSGIAADIATGLISGLPVFVGDSGLPITDASVITLPAAVQTIGVALSPTTVSLAIHGQYVRRA